MIILRSINRPVFNYRSLIFTSFFLGFIQLAHSQSPAHSVYNTQQGLVCEEIYDVHQDKMGFLWVASDRGVFRFNGYSFQPFTTAQGLTDNTVFRLSEDYRGRIWLLPFNGEICYIENDKVVSYQYNDTLEKYLPGVRIARSINVDPAGAVEIGFLMHGYVNVSPEGKLNIESIPPHVNRKYWARESNSGRFIMGSYLGNVENGAVLIEYNDVCLDSLIKVPNYTHLSGLKRKNGSSIFCVGQTVYETTPSGVTVKSDLPVDILCVIEDSEECLWIGTNGKGIYKYEAGALVAGGVFEQFFPDVIITSIEEDSEGSFWVATHHNGLLYLPNVNIRAWSFFTDDEACEFLPDSSGRMYVLWRDHGLTRIDGDSALIFPPEPERKSYCALAWSRRHNALLIGSTHGAFEFDLTSNSYRKIFTSAANSITCKDSNIYIGQSWNLCKLSPAGQMKTFSSGKVRHRPDVLFEDRAGTVWVGALDGLYRIDGDSMISVATYNELFTHRIAGICDLPDSTLVVATQSNGLAFMKNDVVRTITQNDGFPCDVVYGIVTGAGNTIWCSTEEGLYQITCSQDTVVFSEQLVMRSIVRHGGKPGYISSGNQLWLCDGNQVISFNTSLSTHSVPPRIYVTEVETGDSILSTVQKAQLEYNQNSLRISFCGIAYRLQGNIQYRYRLAGSGEDWKYTRQNVVEFAALAPGDYLFEVSAQNEAGEWSVQPAVFAFAITTPFWSTWWFLAACIVIGGLLMYLMFMLRFRMVRRRDLLREQALIFRQQALASQMNPHFVFNTLNTIQALVLKEDKTRALDMFSSFASLLRKSLEHSTERFISLEEELKILHLYFELEEMRFDGNLSYQIILGHNIDVHKLSVPAMLIQPLIENALVHGIRRKEDGGRVDVRFDFINEHLIVHVEDNGIGRAASSQIKKQHRSSGTKITRDRLRVLGQMNNQTYLFEIIDKTNQSTGEALGTIVKLELPYVLNRAVVHDAGTQFTEPETKNSDQ